MFDHKVDRDLGYILLAQDFLAHHAGVLVPRLVDHELLTVIPESLVEIIGRFFQVDDHVRSVVERVSRKGGADQALVVGPHSNRVAFQEIRDLEAEM